MVDGHLGFAAVSARFDKANHDGQDQVFVVDVKKRQPKLLYTLLVGKGDLQTAYSATGSTDRFAYASVAIMPKGQIAVSFDDSTTNMAPGTSGNQPNLAILQRPAITQ